MIKVKGNKAYFTGKDAIIIKETAMNLGLSVQDTFTGLLWEHLMRLARQGTFKKGKK